MTDLAAATREAFSGHPARTLELLASPSQRAAPGAAWVLVVAHGALGHYQEALRIVDARPPVDARTSAVAASIYRQVGMHGEALRRDRAALAAALRTGDVVGECDARIGLAADHVGLETAQESEIHLAAAGRLLHGRGGDWVTDHWPRQQVRRMWVTCELRLLQDRPADAAVAAERAVSWSGPSARHLAKSLLFRGVARVPAADVADLEAAVAEASSVSATPLLWPTYLVLSRIRPTAAGRSEARDRARQAYTVIGEHLAADMPAAWWTSPAAVELGLEPSRTLWGPAGRVR